MRRIDAASVQQDEVLRAEHFHGVIDLFHGAHAGGENDRPAFAARVAQQAVVGERSRCNLEAGDVELIDEIHRLLVPAGGEPGHLDFAAIAVDQAVLVVPELQPALEIAVGGAEGILAGLGQFFGGVDDVHGALLKLHGVAARRYGHADQPAREVDIAVMVDADLGDDVAGVAIADQPAADRNRGALFFVRLYKHRYTPTRMVIEAAPCRVSSM